MSRVVRRAPTLQTALFLVSADGSGARRLTYSALAEYWPAWTADGRHVLFSREQRPNRGYLFYAPSDAAPGWSPNGRRITFTRGDGVYVNADGTGARRIASGEGSGSWGGPC